MIDVLFPKLHKEGYRFLAIAAVITFVLLLISNFLGIISFILTIWVYYFFRDPDRFPINDENYLLSPADGVVSQITEINGPKELGLENKKFSRVSIFMKNKNGDELIIVQIAGLIARRIVCEVQENEEISQGEKFGMIRFGSRVDLYFENYQMMINLNQKTIAGETIIARKK